MRAKMAKLTKQINEEIKSPSDSIISFLAKLHHDFLSIHPFDDGNGRVGRILLNYVLLRLGYPPMVIKSGDRENYLIALQKADIGDIEALEFYMGKVLISWLEIGIKAAKGEDISEPSDVDKELEIFIKSKEKILVCSDIDSKKILVDGFFAPLFKTLKLKLAPFKKIFHSHYSRINDKLLGGLDELEFEKFSHIENKNLFNTFPKDFKKIKIQIEFSNYKYLERHYNFCMIIYAELFNLQYKIDIEILTYFIHESEIMPSAIIKDTMVTIFRCEYFKKYNDIWTQKKSMN